MIVYKKSSGLITHILPPLQTIEGFYHHYSEDFKKDLAIYNGDDVIDNLSHYRIVDGVLSKLNQLEIDELSEYFKILSDEERLVNKLIPSRDEIGKAKRTIEFIDLMSEVL